MKTLYYFLILLAFLFLHGAVKSQVNLQNGLVAAYDFNGSVRDITGNNHDGTIVNSLSYADDRLGRPNSAIRFTGDGNYISIKDDGKLSTANISISLWFKSNTDDLQVLLGKRKFNDDGTASGGAQYQFFINYNLFPGIGSNLVGNNASCINASSSSYINSIERICKERWYHAVITYDGVFHKIYINGVLKRNEPTNFNAFLQCSSELRLGIWWALDKRPYNGLMDDLRWYNRALNQDEVSALFDNYSVAVPLDFTFAQNPCAPNTFQFFASDQSASTYSWDFGNGVTSFGNSSPRVNYNTVGNYTVKLQSGNGACTASVQKSVSVGVEKANVILTSDTTICSGNSLRLVTDSGLNFCWKTDPSLTNTSIANTIARPSVNTTYYFTSQALIGNLVVNGDFSQGNSGFTSEYKHTPANKNAAEYSIANDPQAWNNNFTKCSEHTVGNGNMMIINGSSIAGAKVWSENLVIAPNTNYAFSVWIESLAGTTPASLRFSINGRVIGDNITATNPSCQWKQFFITWNSGSETAANIAIENSNTVTAENYFALDDISFSRVVLRQDSIKVNVTPPPVIHTRSDTAICAGTSIRLNTTGAIVYNWSPATGLSDPTGQNPVATPVASTSYIVSGYLTPGCAGTDTVKIDVLPGPDVRLTNDTTICLGTNFTLSAQGGEVYKWSPTTGLSADNIPNPIASPNDTTRYYVNVRGANGCSKRDSVAINVARRPSVSAMPDTAVCRLTPVVLRTSSSDNVGYSWYPATAVNDPFIASPVANNATSMDYIVTVKNVSNCEVKDTIHVTALDLPVITTSNDTLVCKGYQVPLTASGGVSYHWTPETDLSDPSSNSPVAAADHTTTYKVLVTSNNGCSGSDSVRLTVKPLPDYKIEPLTASVCKDEMVTLKATGGDVYNWLNAGSAAPLNTNVAVVKPETNTVYQVRIFDTVCKHIDTLSATITIKPVPQVTIQKSNDIDCDHPTALLTAAGGSRYLWSPAVGLNSATVANPIVSADLTTNYTVTATNSDGCTSKDSIKVTVNFAGGPANGYNLPNAFTPNNDGKNDCFGVNSWGAISQLDFSIYNRWGERVFYTTDASRCWNGTYKNLPQDMGSYVYYIKAKTACGGEFSRKGTLVLIR